MLGWFGLVFLVIGVADIALVWYPLRPGNPSWEFGAVDLSFSSLPILTIGVGAMLASALGAGDLRRAAVFGVMSLLLGLLCALGYLVFLSDVPLALRNSPAEVLVGVKKAIFRNTLFGVTFATAYITVGIATLRHTRAVKREGSHAS